MDWQQVAADWPAFLGAIKTRWPQVDDTEVLAMDGDRERFEAHLSDTHELTRAEARELVDVWLAGELPADVAMAERRDNRNISASARHIPAGEDVYAEDNDFGDDRVEQPPLGRSSQT